MLSAPRSTPRSAHHPFTCPWLSFSLPLSLPLSRACSLSLPSSPSSTRVSAWHYSSIARAQRERKIERESERERKRYREREREKERERREHSSGAWHGRASCLFNKASSPFRTPRTAGQPPVPTSPSRKRRLCDPSASASKREGNTSNRV